MRCREVRLEYGEPDVKGQSPAARSEANAYVRIPKIVASCARAYSVNKRIVRRTEAERLADKLCSSLGLGIAEGQVADDEPAQAGQVEDRLQDDAAGEELAQLYNPDPFAMPRWRAPVYRTPLGIILAVKVFKLLAWIARLIDAWSRSHAVWPC